MCQYDEIADVYDALFTDRESLAENEEVGRMIGLQPGESVYDIGCGTGLFVEITGVAPKDYVGIDPSGKMLKHFCEKHPEFRDGLANGYFEEDTKTPKAGLIVSLFGAPSYLPEQALWKIVGCESRLFLMFYKPDYHPVTYEKLGVEFEHFLYTEEKLESIFGEGTAREWHNFIIIDRR